MLSIAFNLIEPSFRRYRSFQGQVWMKTLISGKWSMFSKLQLDNCGLPVSKPNTLTEVEVNHTGRGIELWTAFWRVGPVELSWTLSKFSVAFCIVPSQIFPQGTWRLFYLSPTCDHTMNCEMTVSKKTREGRKENRIPSNSSLWFSVGGPFAWWQSPGCDPWAVIN